MTFLAPWAFLLLAVVAVLAGAYVYAQRQRARYAVRFTNLDLLDVVAPDRPGWRRHLPAALLLSGLAAMTVAVARPARESQVPREQATIIVAIDTSLSMLADDVAPSRIDAAKQAASSFVEGLPESLNVGLVDFNGVVSVRVAPTTDHAKVQDAIAALELGEGTAIGDALKASVGAVADIVEAPANGAEGDGARDRDGGPVRVILMSDGKTTVGSPDEEGIRVAEAVGIPVSTIAFGTQHGTVTIGDRNPIPVPVDSTALEAIAEATGGTFFEAATGDELSAVYDDIGSAIGFDLEQVEVGWWFTAVALVCMLAAAGLSLLWFNRLP
ncbi:MAG: VWA domain-containing protein [Acidimicrobiia bacterium]|nr:VWA domain-containing protein [Acidimicrobiia bacterium]